jgi:NAD-dependent dihydropyrimidine dehydrogenase PreA subunit
MSTDSKAAAAGTAAVHNPIVIDEKLCIRCNLCDWICPGDIIYKIENDKTTMPEVVYPDECWYCGLCQSICPTEAIKIVFPDVMINNKSDVIRLLGKIVD